MGNSQPPFDETSRRRFVQGLGTAAASSAALSQISSKVSAINSDPSDREIPYVAGIKTVKEDGETVFDSKTNNPKTKKTFKTVREDRYLKIEAAHKAANRIQNKVEALSRRLGKSSSQIETSVNWKSPRKIGLICALK